MVHRSVLQGGCDGPECDFSIGRFCVVRPGWNIDNDTTSITNRLWLKRLAQDHRSVIAVDWRFPHQILWGDFAGFRHLLTAILG